MSARATAKEEPFVGKKLSSSSWVIIDAMLDAHYNGVDLPRPAADNGLPRVPSMLASEPEGNYFNEIAFSSHIGHLWMRQQWEFFKPLELGGAYTSSGSIVDIYQKRDRTVVQYRVDLSDAFWKPSVRCIRTPIKAPKANAFSESFIESLKRECLNKFMCFGLDQLDYILKTWIRHYHTERPHRGVGRDNTVLDDTFVPKLCFRPPPTIPPVGISRPREPRASRTPPM